MFASGCFQKPCRALCKRVLAINIDSGMKSKSLFVGRMPSSGRRVFRIYASGECRSHARRVVVVDDVFIFLPVSFSWREYHTAAVLEHRDEIGDDDGLRKKVFRRTKQERTLKLPEPFCLVEVASMACPQTDVPVLKPVRYPERAVLSLHPRSAVKFHFVENRRGIGRKYIAVNQIFDGNTCARESYLIFGMYGMEVFMPIFGKLSNILVGYVVVGIAAFYVDIDCFLFVMNRIFCFWNLGRQCRKAGECRQQAESEPPWKDITHKQNSRESFL